MHGVRPVCRGVGLQLAKDLAACGVRVVLGCRSAKRSKTAVAAIKQGAPGADVSVVAVDLTDLASVVAASDEIKRRCVLGITSCRSTLTAASGGCHLCESVAHLCWVCANVARVIPCPPSPSALSAWMCWPAMLASFPQCPSAGPSWHGRFFVAGCARFLRHRGAQHACCWLQA